MRNRLALASFYALPLVGAAFVWACSNSGDNPQVNVGNDGGAEGGDDAGDDGSLVNDVGSGLPDGQTNVCTLSDHVTDPVGLCILEQELQFELQYAYVKGQGVAPSWSSAAPYAHASGHRWQDDLALAGTIGGYYCSSEVYGNNDSTAAFSAVLLDLGPILVGELQQSPPTGYDGETYFRLRWAQAAYNYANDSAHAGALQALADAYGQALAGQAYAVAPSAGTGDAGAGDAGAGDGGGATGNPGGVVIGSKNGDGSVAYAPAQTLMAAAALLDMANVHAKDPDAGAAAQGWAATAQQVIAYVLARGRDPVTGLFFQALVTSADAGHDALGSAQPTSDTFLTDDQAWIILGLARAQDLAVSLPPAGDAGDAGEPTPGFAAAAAALSDALAAAGLFDGTTSPGTSPPPGAFMEGLAPTGVLTNKTTTGNAILLGALHRVAIVQGTNEAYTLGQVRAALLQPLPSHSSLLSIVTDTNGNAVQQAYLRAGSKGFDYAVAYGPDGGAAGQEQGATDYRTDAMHAMVEGMTQLWHGTPNNPSCTP